jgi:peptide/nickel transport system substrate-binding protein
MKRNTILAGSLALALLVAVACAPAATPTQAPQGQAAPAKAAEPAQAKAAPAAGQPTRGGQFVYARDADADSLDPQYVTATEAGNSLMQVYDTLLWRDFDGKTYKPQLAQSWDVSPDGLTYTFTLRKDVTFHSGKKLTSADVKYTLDRWRGTIKGKPSPTRNYLEGLGEVETPDDSTVVLRMKKPNNFLLDNLSHPFSSIVNQQSVEKAGDDYGSQVVDGTGPFKLVEWTRSDRMRLERFADYKWAGPGFSNQGAAYVDSLLFRTVPEHSTRAVTIQRGEAQVVRSSGLVPLLDQIKRDPNLVITPFDVLNTRFAAFKTAKPKLADVRVRRAYNMAIDRQALVDTVEKGLGQPAYSFLHPSTKYYWPGLKELAYTYDPDGARKLLDEAGWKVGAGGIREKDGEKLSLDLYAGQDNEEELVLSQAMLKEVGIQLNLKLVDRAALYEIRRTETPDINYIYLPYDNASTLYSYFHSSQMPAPNRFNFADPEVDKLLERGQSAPNEQEAAQAYYEVQKRIHEQALYAPILHRQNFTVTRKEVQGFKPYLVYDMGLPKLIDVSIQK